MAELDYQYLDVLAERAVLGSSDAFAELYAASYKAQYQLACYFTKDIYLAQDALEYLYIYALQNIRQLVDATQFTSWLEQINLQVCSQLLPEAKLREIPPESKRTHIGKLDQRGADILLTAVLKACGYPPHTRPVSEITNIRMFRRERYVLQKAVIGLMLLGLLLMPFLFLTPHVTISVTGGDETPWGQTTRQYNCAVSSILRVASATATLNGKELPVYETAPKVYTIEPDREEATGTAEITITLENGQYTTATVAFS